MSDDFDDVWPEESLAEVARMEMDAIAKLSTPTVPNQRSANVQPTGGEASGLSTPATRTHVAFVTDSTAADRERHEYQDASAVQGDTGDEDESEHEGELRDGDESEEDDIADEAPKRTSELGSRSINAHVEPGQVAHHEGRPLKRLSRPRRSSSSSPPSLSALFKDRKTSNKAVHTGSVITIASSPPRVPDVVLLTSSPNESDGRIGHENPEDVIDISSSLPPSSPVAGPTAASKGKARALPSTPARAPTPPSSLPPSSPPSPPSPVSNAANSSPVQHTGKSHRESSSPQSALDSPSVNLNASPFSSQQVVVPPRRKRRIPESSSTRSSPSVSMPTSSMPGADLSSPPMPDVSTTAVEHAFLDTEAGASDLSVADDDTDDIEEESEVIEEESDVAMLTQSEDISSFSSQDRGMHLQSLLSQQAGPSAPQFKSPPVERDPFHFKADRKRKRNSSSPPPVPASQRSQYERDGFVVSDSEPLIRELSKPKTKKPQTKKEETKKEETMKPATKKQRR